MHGLQKTILCLIAACLLFSVKAQGQAILTLKTPAAPNLSQDHVLYLIGYSHLDTEWRWNYPQVIREFLPDTLHQNFSLFEKYPDYIFNWTGSNRYRLMKEYYPADYAKLKQYVKAGRWFPNGSNVEEGDVDIPSEESIIRQILYGNQFYRREFGVASDEFMIPDCFGFPASLPSIFAHSGLKGFSTQKLTWGSAVGIPFNVGVWEGTDGQSVIAALNPGSYGSSIDRDMSHDPRWIQRVETDGAKSGVYTDYRYYGVGDRGGAPSEDSVKWLETSLQGGGPLQVRSARANEMFDAITPAQRAGLPRYKGDLLLTGHSTGSLSSEAAMKRWNRKNELLADAAERASVAADWLGAAPYDRARLTDAWLRFLPGQFHDIMAGTALPASYDYAWNDQVIALNEFSGTLSEAAGGVARSLDTRARGVPLVVYNPLSNARQDCVTANVTFPGAAPAFVRVFGPDGLEVPSQIAGRNGTALQVLFLAHAPSVGFAVYDVRPAASPAPINAALRVTLNNLENARYRVRLNAAGDIAGITDKVAHRELLSAPARLAFQHENPVQWPAWNMDWDDQRRLPSAYVDGQALIKIVENGPARVALQITRQAQGSRVVQTIRLAAGTAGNRIEVANTIDWQSQETALKAVFPLSVSNPQATYNWELGTIQRGNNDPKKFEVPSHKWFDVTDTNNGYGVSVLDDCKYGSDKPSDNTVRLTLLYTPGIRGGYQDQATQDWGRHEFVYGLVGHSGDWRQGQTQWEAGRLNQPLIAFQPRSHPGAQGHTLSLARVSTPQVSIEALKQAEESHEIIVRLNELSGKAAPNVHLSCAAPIVSAREVDGQEQPLGAATVQNGQLVFSMQPYRPRAFALTLGKPAALLTAPRSVSLLLPYNVSVCAETPSQPPPYERGGARVRTVPSRTPPLALRGRRGGGSPSVGRFDPQGNALPSEMLPATLNSNGVTFRLAPRKPGQPDAVACAGQTLILPAGKGRRVYLLTAAYGGDRQATFQIDGKPVSLTVPNWDTPVGQWDKRLWGGQVPELTYDWHNPLIGLVPGFIKTATVAWYSDHKRLPNGENDPYGFCYLFREALAVPNGAHTLRLPNDPHIRILAASVAADPNADTRPAQPLVDTLNREGGRTPTITPGNGTFHDVTQVTLHPPLYYTGTLHYTVDGTMPGPNSPVYTGPLLLASTATVRAVASEENGRVGPVVQARLVVHDTTPPTLLSAFGIAGTPAITLQFSEPLSRADAERASQYQFADGSQAASARLSDDGMRVTLTLAHPLAVSDSPRLTALGARDLAGNPARSVGLPPLEIVHPAFALTEEHAFDGKSAGLTQTTVPTLPTARSASWTINQFVWLDHQPDELTAISGFGDATDRSGQQRYLAKFHNGIHFWGSNIDIPSGVPFDLGRWQMLTVTYDGQTVRLYKDGLEIKAEAAAFADAAPTVRLAPPSPWDNGAPFVGRIAGFTVWNRALPAEAVRALRSTGSFLSLPSAK